MYFEWVIKGWWVDWDWDGLELGVYELARLWDDEIELDKDWNWMEGQDKDEMEGGRLPKVTKMGERKSGTLTQGVWELLEAYWWIERLFYENGNFSLHNSTWREIKILLVSRSRHL